MVCQPFTFCQLMTVAILSETHVLAIFVHRQYGILPSPPTPMLDGWDRV
jgi:hypothetical protein